MHFRHTFAIFQPKNLYLWKFGGENSNLAEFYSRFDGQLSISSGTADSNCMRFVLKQSIQTGVKYWESEDYPNEFFRLGNM